MIHIIGEKEDDSNVRLLIDIPAHYRTLMQYNCDPKTKQWIRIPKKTHIQAMKIAFSFRKVLGGVVYDGYGNNQCVVLKDDGCPTQICIDHCFDGEFFDSAEHAVSLLLHMLWKIDNPLSAIMNGFSGKMPDKFTRANRFFKPNLKNFELYPFKKICHSHGLNEQDVLVNPISKITHSHGYTTFHLNSQIYTICDFEFDLLLELRENSEKWISEWGLS